MTTSGFISSTGMIPVILIMKQTIKTLIMDWERKAKKNKTYTVTQGDCSCGSIEDEHPCPYLVFDQCDDETLCTCCPACTKACVMETGDGYLIEEW